MSFGLTLWILTHTFATGVLNDHTIADVAGDEQRQTGGVVERNPDSLEIASADSIDSIILPSTERRFVSPNAKYVFEVFTVDSWKSQTPSGRFIELGCGQEKVVWTGGLPHEYGPRFVIVGNNAKVLLVDEWINVKSRYALTIFDPYSVSMRHYHFDHLQKILKVPVARIVEQAKTGWWVTKPPRAGPCGVIVRIETAGKILEVNLKTSDIDVAPGE